MSYFHGANAVVCCQPFLLSCLCFLLLKFYDHSCLSFCLSQIRVFFYLNSYPAEFCHNCKHFQKSQRKSEAINSRVLCIRKNLISLSDFTAKQEVSLKKIGVCGLPGCLPCRCIDIVCARYITLNKLYFSDDLGRID